MRALSQARLARIGVFGLAALACTEDPSLRLEWRIASDPTITQLEDAPELLSVKQCSDAGIEKVRLEVWKPEGSSPVETIEYACFPRAFAKGQAIDGPPLDPGDYELQLIGLRRNGSDWLCPSMDDMGNPVEIPCVRGSGSVAVAEGELPEVRFLIHAPNQCDDGIDNDRDGHVDGGDPACQLGESIESYDAGLTLLQISVGFLDNPLIEPVHLGSDEDETSVEVMFGIDGGTMTPQTVQAGDGSLWPWRLPLLDARLDAGEHTAELAIHVEGVPATQTLSTDFVVDAQDGAFVVWEASFLSADFLEPIVDEAALAYGMGATAAVPACGPTVDGQPAVDRLRIRMLEDGASIQVELGDWRHDSGPLADPLVEANDWLSFACDSAGRLRSIPLTWVDTPREIEIEGLVDGVTCYASGPLRVRPGSFTPLTVLAPPTGVGGCPPR